MKGIKRKLKYILGVGLAGCLLTACKGGASEADISALIAYVQRIVKEQTGVVLEPEVKRIGGTGEWIF